MTTHPRPPRDDRQPPDPPRAPFVPTAALGDGSLLAVLGRDGDLQQAWWPHPDRRPTVARSRMGLRVDGVGAAADAVADAAPGAVRWAADAAATQVGDPDRGLVRTDLRVDLSAPVGTVDVGLEDLVAADGPALVRRITVSVPVMVVLRVDPASRATWSAGAEGDGAALRMRWQDREAVLLVVPSPDDGRDPAHRPAEVDVDAAGATIAVRVTAAATVVLAFGAPDDEAGPAASAASAGSASVDSRDALAGPAERLARRLVTADHAVLVAARRAADAALLARRTPTLVDGDLDALDRASVRVLVLLTDRTTGATIAGPDCDPDHVRSGGYGHVWPRDQAIIVLAQLAAGLHDEARAAVRWLARAQSADGLWEQRHHTDATVAPGWGRQLDETGATLFAMAEAVRTLEDAALAATVWPSVVAGADALVATLDPATGLPAPSFDVWEERFGVHTFTAAATVAGLEGAADLADARDAERARRWREAAARVRAGIDRWLWSEADGRFLRSRDVARPDGDGAPVPDGHLRAARPDRPVGSVDPVDATVDVSLAGLVHPFGVLAHDDPRVVATLDAIDRALRSPRGGVGRYAGDTYVGGNPWVLAGLWVGLARRPPGAAVPADGIDLARAVATPTWLLPEQFDAATLAPRWVVPLAWSHALFMLAVRQTSPSSPASAAASARPVTPSLR